MQRRILILQGHPDPRPDRLCVALAGAYAEGARDGGHEVRLVEVGKLEFPLLRSREAWESAGMAPAVRAAQEDIAWAEHLVIVYPLWLGGMPALLKGFLEQVARPGFAVPRFDTKDKARKLLAGRSARIVVTMGMPALLFRWFFGAHSLKSLERNILGFVGIAPIRESLFGLVESVKPARRARWLETLRNLGVKGI
jgi:putative NADPH-quinone reductase